MGRYNYLGDAMSLAPIAPVDEAIEAVAPLFEWLDNRPQPTKTTSPSQVATAEVVVAATEEGKQTAPYEAAIQQWRDAQDKDPDLKKAREFLTDKNAARKWPKQMAERVAAAAGLMKIGKSGCLYYSEKPNSKKPEWRIVVPRSQKESLMKEYHEGFGGAHRSHKQATSRLQAWYWWPRMARDVERYIRSCMRCQESSFPIGPEPGMLHNIPPPEGPGLVWHIDVLNMGPSGGGEKKIQVAVDAFSRWAELRAVKAATGAETVKFIEQNLLRSHGIPEEIRYDNGKENINKEVKALLDMLGIKGVRISPYHPQANGMAERVNKSIIAHFRRVVSEDAKDWDIHLPRIQYAYNCAINESTGYSPFRLQMGRDPPQGIDIELGLAHTGGLATRTCIQAPCENGRRLGEE